MTDRTLNPNAMHTVAGKANDSAPVAAPATLHPTQSLLWSVRRELWEHRSIYVAPLAVAALLILGIAIAAFTPFHGNISISDMDTSHQLQLLGAPFDIASYALMAAAFLVAFFYSLDALYGERRDRSILFWKSMPVSDITAVLSKSIVPIVVIPLVCFAVAIVTQAILALLVTIGLAAHGVHPAVSLTQLPLAPMSAMLLFHLIVIHGLWYAPFYGWLLLVSSFARRAPFLWAIMPPLGIMLVEKLAFGTTYFADHPQEPLQRQRSRRYLHLGQRANAKHVEHASVRHLRRPRSLARPPRRCGLPLRSRTGSPHPRPPLIAASGLSSPKGICVCVCRCSSARFRKAKLAPHA